MHQNSYKTQQESCDIQNYGLLWYISSHSYWSSSDPIFLVTDQACVSLWRLVFKQCLNVFIISSLGAQLVASLVPRPLSDFILQPWRTKFSRGWWDKIWEWPGDEASHPLCSLWRSDEKTQALPGIIENVKLRRVRLLCKMRGETDSQEILLSNLKQVV